MNEFDLDTPLFELPSSSGTDYWSIRHSCQSLGIFGSTGSGKTSSSGKMISLNFLRKNYGGLILTVKPDDVDLWISYCEMTGRTEDLIIIKPGGPHKFNILDHASGHNTDELAATDNIVELLNEVIQAGQAQDSGQNNDPFWRDQVQLIITNVVDLVKLAYKRISIQDMYNILLTIPKEEDAMQDAGRSTKAFHRAFEAARVNVTEQIDVWMTTLTQDEQAMMQDDVAFENALMDAVPDARLLKFIDGYFVDEFIPLNPKTRSIIQVSVSAFMFRLLREPFYSLFCRHTSTVTPEDCFDGKIVLINLPIKRYHKAGRNAQMICKYIFQRAWEKRDVKLNPRPCFLFVDEAHNFLTESDSDFLTTVRSSRIATVFLTQSISNYYAAMGGPKAEYRVRSLLGNMGTKIFHCNTDEPSNEFASKLIGDAFFEDTSESITVAQNFSQTRGRSLKLERVVRPEQFVNLLTGGPKNSLRCEGYIHRQGEGFANGFNHLKTTFKQDYRPK